VTPDFTLQLAGWGTKGGEHLAFAMSRKEFDEVFRRVIAAKIEYGDDFHSVGNMRGPGDETSESLKSAGGGARGPGKNLYFFDPSRHLIEIRTMRGKPSVADLVAARDFHPGVDQIVGLVGLEAAVFHGGEDFEDGLVAIQSNRRSGSELRRLTTLVRM